MARLRMAGHVLLPLGGGSDGKAPIVRNWAGPALNLAQVLGPMHGAGSTVYGVRLDGMAVIDCDSDDTALVAEMERRFGSSPVHVRTPRGRHIYYAASPSVPNLRSEGLQVDVKSGARSYVVGPMSQRADGGEYFPVKGVLGRDRLPQMRVVAEARSPTIQPGHRHQALVREAIQRVKGVESVDTLFEQLAEIRDKQCISAPTLPDSELWDIASWAWTCRLDNRVYEGRNSAFPVHRAALDALRGQGNQSDAVALLVLLEDQHGHSPGKRFSLNFGGMREAGLTNLSAKRLRAARRTLERCGLLELASKHRAGSRPQTYVLKRLSDGLQDLPATSLRRAANDETDRTGSKRPSISR